MLVLLKEMITKSCYYFLYFLIAVDWSIVNKTFNDNLSESFSFRDILMISMRTEIG